VLFNNSILNAVIDTARDILCRQSPRSEVPGHEQITIALIYKFTWTIRDAGTEEWRKKRKFSHWRVRISTPGQLPRAQP